jgi:hypothetical protein
MQLCGSETQKNNTETEKLINKIKIIEKTRNRKKLIKTIKKKTKIKNLRD